MSDKMLSALVMPQPGGEGPDWVKSMREHFAQTGAYRPADLRRLLGDPRAYTEVKFTTDLDMACQYLGLPPP